MLAMPPLADNPMPNDSAHEPPPPPERSIVEIVWGAAATALAVVYTAVLAPCVALVSMLGYPHLATPISRFWGWLIVNTSGVKVVIEGLEHLAGLDSYVLVSNHQSFFDIFA